MRSPTTNEVVIFNPKKDRIETRTIRFRTLKEPLAPHVKVEIVPQNYGGLDPNDRVRAPILRILMERKHELDPRVDCVRGVKAECNLYDGLVRVSDAFLEKTPKWERKLVLTSPESAFMRGEPRFCAFCVFEEHRRRKWERHPWRRFTRWLTRSK